MQPPKKALGFLRWFCREEYIEEIEGDLVEVFRMQYRESPKRAKLLFTLSVIRYFRPEFIKSFKSFNQPNSVDMFRNYFRVAMRGLIRNNGYSFINIGGLALGMTVTILIGLWIYDELSFDKYHKNYDSIGQVWGGQTDPESLYTHGSYALQLPMGAVLRNNYQHYFKHVLLAWWEGEYPLSFEEHKLIKTGQFIEAGAPEMLSLKMLSGTYECLKDRHSIILSASTAKAMFGSEDAMNKVLKINNNLEVKVTGVYEDIPKNNRFSEIQFFGPWDLWYSANEWIRRNENNWSNKFYLIFVQLKPGITMDMASHALHDFYYKNLPKDVIKEIDKYKPFAQVVPMSKWHLYSEFRNGKPATGRITFVWLFGVVGAFVLLLACINFINLSTARSEKRAREVGVRKSVGSGQYQLIMQFLCESFLVVVIAFVVSMVILRLSQAPFNDLADKEISLPLTNGIFWLIMLAFILVTAFMAGTYPAFYLSSFQPLKVLKGTMRLGRFASLPRKILVVVQFTVSVILIVGTVLVFQQIRHARNRPIGYDRSGLINLPMNDPNFIGKHDVIRNELLNTGVVADVAYSSNPLTQIWNHAGGFTWTGRDLEKDNSFGVINVSKDFGATIGWEIISGRDFKDMASDSAALIINETAARYMHLKNPLDEIIGYEGRPEKWKIIGVVKDIVMESPYQPVKQTFFFTDYKNEATNQIQIKFKPTVGPVEALPKVEAVLRKLVPTSPFDFKFVDQEYALKFAQEQRIGKLSGIFAAFAIFISCLGLFGLASFVAERRTKEIGIRKVLGASVTTLWKMLSKDFVILVIVSCVIAIPISYLMMSEWLKLYQYRTEITWWIFLLTILGALTITILTVSFQAVKAALMNPVKSLRSE
jgi:putative ABC transport system permease protein